MSSTDTPESYDNVPKSVVKSELEVLSFEKWQREWDQSTKGQITKQYFPDITARLNMKINLTHNFTLLVTRHGNINSYLHRFKISELIRKQIKAFLKFTSAIQTDKLTNPEPNGN